MYRRLQGLGFQANYTPTPEIQIAPIFWTYGSHEDQVKVSVYINQLINRQIVYKVYIINQLINQILSLILRLRYGTASTKVYTIYFIILYTIYFSF